MGFVFSHPLSVRHHVASVLIATNRELLNTKVKGTLFIKLRALG